MLFIANEVSTNKLLENVIVPQFEYTDITTNETFESLLKDFQFYNQHDDQDHKLQKKLLKESTYLKEGDYKIDLPSLNAFVTKSPRATLIIISDKEAEDQCLHLIFEGIQDEYPQYLKGEGFEEEIILLDKKSFECLNPWESITDYSKYKGTEAYDIKVESLKAKLEQLQQELAIVEGRL